MLRACAQLVSSYQNVKYSLASSLTFDTRSGQVKLELPSCGHSGGGSSIKQETGLDDFKGSNYKLLSYSFI